MPEIDTDAVYKKLKKQNGERVARVIRGAVLLDVPNIVHILEFAGNDSREVEHLVPIIRDIYKNKEESTYHTHKKPLELLDEAGYKAFVVKTEEQKNSIRGYYRDGEAICTLRDPHRHENYYMIHAIKKEVWGDDKLPESEWHIKPANKPERQDEYGTSVISIQIAKSGGFISIKNRYNHTISDPDNTFNSNPDEIIPGLSESLQNYFNVDFNTAKNPLPNHFRMVNDQLVRYTHEINNVYFGPDYYFSGSDITKLDKDCEIILDYFVLNAKKKTITNPSGTEDCAFDILKDAVQGKKITITKQSNDGDTKVITVDGKTLATVQDGQLTSLDLPNVTEIGEEFLSCNRMLESINLPNVRNIGNYFLCDNEQLRKIDLPFVKKIGSDFLRSNNWILSVSLPNVESVGSCFMLAEHSCSVDMPSLKQVGHCFMENNQYGKISDLSKLEDIGNCFLKSNEVVESLNLPNVEKIGDEFLCHNEKLNFINIPNCNTVGNDFLSSNKMLKSLIAPRLTHVGWRFLQENNELTNVYVPVLKSVGGRFLVKNNTLTGIDLPSAELIGGSFMSHNNKITSIDLPNVEKIGENFLTNNTVLSSIQAPKLRVTGDNFLTGVMNLKELHLPNVEKIGAHSLKRNTKFVSVNLPCAETINAGDWDLNQPNLHDFYAPKLNDTEKQWLTQNKRFAIAMSLGNLLANIQKRVEKLAQENNEKLDELDEKTAVAFAEIEHKYSRR